MFSGVTHLSERVNVVFDFSVLGRSGQIGIVHGITKAGYVTVAASCVVSVNYTFSLVKTVCFA